MARQWEACTCSLFIHCRSRFAGTTNEGHKLLAAQSFRANTLRHALWKKSFPDLQWVTSPGPLTFTFIALAPARDSFTPKSHAISVHENICISLSGVLADLNIEAASRAVAGHRRVSWSVPSYGYLMLRFAFLPFPSSYVER